MHLPFYILDVFTDTRFAGNPLAVVLDGDALEGARMQAIAREFNLSETVFVLKPQQAAHAAPTADDLAAALGLIPAEIGFENHRPTKFSVGNSFVFVPVASLEAMEKAQVGPQHWAAVMRRQGHTGAFLYCRQTVHKTSSFH